MKTIKFQNEKKNSEILTLKLNKFFSYYKYKNIIIIMIIINYSSVSVLTTESKKAEEG